MTQDQLKRARQFVSILPHSRRLNMQVQSAHAGVVEMRMPYHTDLVGDPRSRVIFGGAVSAMLDTCGGLAVFAHPKGTAVMATLDLRIDYMRAARPGQDVLARAECYHVTHHVAFVRATAYDDDLENPVATAAGAFALDRGTEASG